MMDLIDKVSDQTSESEEMMSHEDRCPERVSSDGTHLKTCADCGTTKTPLWRGGPAGPKSLCNACGIRSRKKRRALMGINKEEKKTKKSTIIIKHSNHEITSNNNSSSSSNNSTSSGESSNKYGDISLKKKLLAFGGKVAYQRPRSSNRKKFGEVEQAAFLLMSLSCGSVYA